MKLPRPATFRARFMMVVLVTSLVALLANAFALAFVEYQAYRRSSLADAQARADILAQAAAAAIAFDDRSDAAASLQALSQDREVLAAGLYKANGRLFASYARSKDTQIPPMAKAPGFHLEGAGIAGFHPVTQNGSTVGSVYLSTRSHIYERVTRYLAVLLGVMAFALALAFAFSTRFERAISAPILEIAGTARRIVERGDYSARARKLRNDETGLLADAFNRMLDEVQRHTTALRLADRRKDEFLATLAHELRNPLAPIANSVQFLKMKTPADPEMGWARDVIERQVRHMARLLDDLLDVGRITSGKLQLRRERVALSSVVEAAVETSRPVVSAGGQSLSIELPREAVWLDADPVRLAQVFSNLINNAAKYTQKSGHIRLAAARADGMVHISVRDDGMGISQEMLPHVFEMFAQAIPALERAQGGLGIGLFLVKSLVQLHGGSVGAESAGPGAGSTFTVRLPLAGRASESSAPNVRRRLAAAHHRVLIADDNEDSLESLAALLRVNGYETHLAHDGTQALEEAAKLRPQVALLDIGMPGMTGYELAKRIRSEEWGRSIVLIAVTGWGQEEDKRRALDAGFDHHLTKPASPEKLSELLRAVLR